MIRSRLLNVIVIAIGAVFLSLAFVHGAEALNDIRFCLRTDSTGGDAQTIAFIYTCLTLFDIAIAVWCICGGVQNLRAVSRERP